MLLTNSAEGVTPSGTTVTIGNSGGVSGNAFDVVTLPSGGSIVSDSAQAAHGALSYLTTIGATAAEAYYGWTTSIGTLGSTAPVFTRAYLYVTSNPGTAFKLISVMTGSSAACGSLILNTAGTVSTINAAGTTIATTTNTVPLNAWCRVELDVTPGTTAGVLTARLFKNPDGQAPTETLNSTGQVLSAGPVDQVRYGPRGTTVANVSCRFDDVGITDAGPMGPSASVAAGWPAMPGLAWLRRFRHRQILTVAAAQQFAIALADTGSADDTGLAVTATIALAESGTGADTLAVTATVPLADAGSAADSIAAGVAISLPESGSAADTLAVTAAPALAEAGAAADTLAVTAAVPLSETATGSDTLAVTAAVPLADAGSAADTLAVQAATNIAVADAGSGADTLTLTAVTTANADTGAAADVLTVLVTLTLAETAAAADTLAFIVGAPPAVKATSGPAVGDPVTSAASAADPRDGTQAVTSRTVSTPAVSDPRDGTASVAGAASSPTVT